MAEDEYRDDLYEILGLEPASDEKQVARAYKKKSLLHHPDRGGDGACLYKYHCSLCLAKTCA